MTLANSYRVLLPILLLILAACGPTPPSEPPTALPPAAPPTIEATIVAPVVPTVLATVLATVLPTTAPTTNPTPESVSVPTTAPITQGTQLSFTAATYTDESAGFELDYPAEWTLDPSSQIGVRGAQALLLSPGTTLETLADGGARVGITTYVWDPKNDLDAYIAQRKIAWDASGFAISREEQWQLADGRAAYIFIVQTPEQPAFFLFTTVGEDYLQIGGDGNLPLIEEIAHTVRPLNE